MNELKGVLNSQDAKISEVLSENFIKFYDYGLLDVGGFYDVNIPSSGVYGGNKHTLKVRKDPNFSAGRVWESYRKNWVWETGIRHSTQPIQYSGCFVNGSFKPATGIGAFAHYVDYNNGRIVFDSAIATNSTVNAAYSHKHYNVIPAEGIPWLREIQIGSFRLDNPNYSFYGSGDWAVLGQTRIQLPAIAVEIVPKTLTPYQLGGGQNVLTDVIFHVFSENNHDAKNAVDIIRYQNDRDINLFDPNKIATSGVFPLNGLGRLNTNGLPSGLYPNLIANHYFSRCTIYNTNGGDVSEISENLYYGVVRSSTNVINMDI